MVKFRAFTFKKKKFKTNINRVINTFITILNKISQIVNNPQNLVYF